MKNEPSMSTPIEFDASFFEDPWKIYAELRTAGRIHRFRSENGLDGWLITDYALARQALVDPRLVKTQDAMAGVDIRVRPRGFRARTRARIRQWTAPWLVSHLLAAEPPEHTRLRKVLQPHFSPRAIAELEDPIRRYADELICGLRTRATFDAVNDYALPLPVTVISHILGVPLDKRDRVAQISKVLSDVVIAAPQQLRSAGISMAALLLPLIRERSRRPKNDLLSDLAVSRARGEMTLREIVSTVALLLIAGHETTTNLIGNTLLTVLYDPTGPTIAELTASARIDALIEESLRYRPPLQSTTLRVATEPFTLDRHIIDKGDMVLVSLASANHDPDKFHSPDTFDITRDSRGHLAFGHGLHHCIGAPLARLEGRIALEKLFDAFPDLRLTATATAVRWRPSVNFLGLQSLMVENTSAG